MRGRSHFWLWVGCQGQFVALSSAIFAEEWCELVKKQAHLVQFTVDHAPPISISECERLFSGAKFTLNPLRTYMKSDLLEAIETLRAWYLQDQQDRDRAEKDIRLKEG